MVALTVTTTQVLPSTGALYFDGLSGVAITPGEPCYLDASDNRIKLGDANLSAAGATVKGIAVNEADSAEKPIRLQVQGTIIIGAGAAPTQGVIYVLGATAGSIHPAADLATGWYVTILGVGDAADGIKMSLQATGILAL